MKSFVHHAAAFLAASAVVAAWPSAARADRADEPVPPSTRHSRVPLYGSQREARTIEESRPNVGLISSGIFTLGVPYVTSVIIASQSDRPGDDKLYVPVAGPWLNLANRGSCGRTAASCDNENTYKVLLVANGVLQGLGALEILGGLFFPETRTVKVASEPQPLSTAVFAPTLRITPTSVGRGYGLAATGTF